MTDAPIRAALRAASDAVSGAICEWHGVAPSPAEARDFAAAAVAAFLNTIPTAWVRDTYGTDEAVFLGFLREALARAEEGEG
jgi:hypothetical protein